MLIGKLLYLPKEHPSKMKPSNNYKCPILNLSTLFFNVWIDACSDLHGAAARSCLWRSSSLESCHICQRDINSKLSNSKLEISDLKLSLKSFFCLSFWIDACRDLHGAAACSCLCRSWDWVSPLTWCLHSWCFKIWYWSSKYLILHTLWHKWFVIFLNVGTLHGRKWLDMLMFVTSCI